MDSTANASTRCTKDIQVDEIDSECSFKEPIGDEHDCSALAPQSRSILVANQLYDSAGAPMFVDRRFWNRDEAKMLRAMGVPYVSSSGRIRPGRVRRTDCECRRHCLNRFSDQELEHVFQHYNNLGCPKKQNEFLRGFIKPKHVKRRRPRKANTSDDSSEKSRPLRRVSFEYRLRIGDHEEQVCLSAIRCAFGITTGRLKSVTRAIEVPVPPKPKDGLQKRGRKPRAQIAAQQSNGECTLNVADGENLLPFLQIVPKQQCEEEEPDAF